MYYTVVKFPQYWINKVRSNLIKSTQKKRDAILPSSGLRLTNTKAGPRDRQGVCHWHKSPVDGAQAQKYTRQRTAQKKDSETFTGGRKRTGVTSLFEVLCERLTLKGEGEKKRRKIKKIKHHPAEKCVVLMCHYRENSQDKGMGEHVGDSHNQTRKKCTRAHTHTHSDEKWVTAVAIITQAAELGGDSTICSMDVCAAPPQPHLPPHPLSTPTSAGRRRQNLRGHRHSLGRHSSRQRVVNQLISAVVAVDPLHLTSYLPVWTAIVLDLLGCWKVGWGSGCDTKLIKHLCVLTTSSGHSSKGKTLLGLTCLAVA